MEKFALPFTENPVISIMQTLNVQDIFLSRMENIDWTETLKEHFLSRLNLPIFVEILVAMLLHLLNFKRPKVN